ncbi:NACHT domain-containing protein [Gordonia sp. NPDC058843]|uniref:NACHT domain-containing protein n=1 Tax=Gordonia sp. NPDC058843 TaxID=3346648 RepID=UPI0036B2910E
MTTPIETAIAKAVGTATTRVAGWMVQLGLRKISDVRAARQLDEVPTILSNVSDLAVDLTDLERSELLKFVSTPEFGELVYKIATKEILRTHGGNPEKYRSSLEDEFDCLLALHLGSDDAAAIVRSKLFDVCSAAVQEAVKTVCPDDQSGVSATVKASLVKSATLLASESIANSSLIKSVEDIQSIYTFESEIRNAVRSMYGAMRLPHAGTSRRVPYERLFVQPRISLSLQAHQDEEINLDGRSAQDDRNLSSEIAKYGRVVLLGDPGGGKTTGSLKLLHDICAGKVADLPALVAFWVPLKDYAPARQAGSSVVDFIESQCRVPFAVPPPAKAVEYLLFNGRAAVFFDGLDELTDTSDRRQVVQAVEGFADKYPTTSVLVTSRRIGYSEAALDPDKFTACELGSFDDDQIESYARRWFSLDDSVDPARQATIAESFLQDSKFVRDLTSNPLMLSLMCGIYSGEGYIPRNRPDVYEKCSLLLFDKWDGQRGIKSRVSFDAHIQSAIRHIAYHEYTADKKIGIPRSELVSSVQSYLLEKRFDDDIEAEQAAVEFVDFCKGRAWVLTEVGEDIFGFTHRTFLEFFTASHLVRLNPDPSNLLDRLWPHILRSEWDVVCQLALQLLGKTVDDGADNFIDLAVQRITQSEEIDAIAAETALSFCIRSLQFIVPRPQVLDALVSACVDSICEFSTVFSDASPGTSRPDYAIYSIHSVTQENRRLTAKYYWKHVKRRLDTGTDQRALSLALYAGRFSHDSAGPSLDHATREDRVWLDADADHSSMVRDALSTYAREFRWAAAEAVRTGLISPTEALETHGVFMLYDPSIAGDVLIPPLAYTLVRTARNGGWVSQDLVRSVTEFLLEAETPWLKASEETRFMTSHMNRGILRGIKQELARKDLAILLSLPFIEIRSGSRRRSELPDNRRIVQAEHFLRGTRTQADTDERRAVDTQPSNRAVRRYYERWLSGEFDTFRADQEEESTAALDADPL